MIFLPVVDRELRVASRKRSTFWTRIIAALVAFLIGTGFLILQVTGAIPFTTAALGKALFGTLTWMCLAAALLGGMFFTSDCLSEEKREGTLGFLFLTDLTGYDVLLGKLFASSLRASFALFGVFPILAITLLMGGVTGAEFWKASLALANALFLSLAAGLLVSSVSRDSQKAMAGTLCLLTTLAAVGPALDLAISTGRFRPLLSASSPVFVFLSAGWSGQTLFWPGLLTTHLIAWLLLAAGCVLLPRTWQERATKIPLNRQSWVQRLKFGGTDHRARLRAKWLSINPVLWLAARERWQTASLWIVTTLLIAAFAAMLVTDQTGIWLAWSYLTNILLLLVYLVVASQSGRFFVEVQRSRLIELILATPLNQREIVHGHWRALLRMFGLPLAVCAVIQFAGTMLAQEKTFKQLSTVAVAMPPPGPATNNVIVVTNSVVSVSATMTGSALTPTGNTPFLSPRLMAFASAFVATLTMVGNVAALCWFGMWMGLNSKNTHVATLKTIVFVQVIPWFVASFASTLIAGLLLVPMFLKSNSGLTSSVFMWFPLLSTVIIAILYLAKNLFFVVWARRNLLSKFRERATGNAIPIMLPPRLPIVGPSAA